MPNKKTMTEMQEAILASVKKEMALPCLTKSARKALLAMAAHNVIRVGQY
jgi:hypothetical protein